VLARGGPFTSNTATRLNAAACGVPRPPMPPRRCARLSALVASSEPAVGSVQRHRLAQRVVDECPRCGWSGYFHQYLATIDGDWSSTVCDNCYADLHPEITVTVRFFSARSAGMKEPFAVIRERSRSDYRFPDLGEQLAWRLSSEHTTVLAEEARGECGHDVTQISRDEAERIAASLAARCRPAAVGSARVSALA